jgi:hypothetical protein
MNFILWRHVVSPQRLIALLLISVLTGSSLLIAAPKAVRVDRMPSGLKKFKGQIVGQLLQKKGEVFVVRVESISKTAARSKAIDPTSAIGKSLSLDIYRNYKKVPAYEKALAAVPVGQKVLIDVVHLKGTRLSVDGRLEKYKAPPKTGSATSSFFGVTFKTSASVDSKVVQKFQGRWALAKADAKAGRLADALVIAEGIAADLPKDLDAVGLAGAIAHLKTEIVKQAGAAKKTDRWNRAIANAIAAENNGKVTDAQKILTQLVAEGAVSVPLTAAVARVNWKVSHSAKWKRVQEQVKSAFGAASFKAAEEAMAGLQSSKEMLPAKVVLPHLDHAMGQLNGRLEGLMVADKLNTQLESAVADANAGKFAEALAKIAALRAALPKDLKIDTRPIDEVEARIRKAADPSK